MAEELIVDKSLNVEGKYKLLIRQLKSIISKDENLISNLSNITAALKETFDKISWVGFYLFDGKKLFVGPFQGKIACMQIEIGKGVCGKAAENKETIIVPDVHQFPGHISCDSGSNSEIVVPVLKEGNLFGVLDVDSYQFSAFDQKDKFYLEEICNFLSEEILT